MNEADIALVGLALPGVENLTMAALRRASARAGLRAEHVGYNGFVDLPSALARVLELAPRVCGVSIQSIESALACLVFTRTLRARGFGGRIVAGGHFATLNAEEILRAGVDVVVRSAGEEALVALARAAPLDTIPGVSWLERGILRTGAPARSLASATSFGVERELPRHLGLVAADLVLSRGCEHRCAYCCVGAASEIERRLGASDAGFHVPSLDDLADEIAALHHAHDARVLHVMDDNLLPREPAAVAEWSRALRAALDEREVPSLAFAMQVRADAIDPSSAETLAELGLARAYVGIDGYSARQLKVLGRRSPADAGPRALALLRANGVFSVANALLVGPTIPFESVQAEIAGIAGVDAAPVHLLPLEVRYGTPLFRSAEQRGLVEGGFLYWHYRFADPRTALMGEILTSLPTRLRDRSVPIALYDLGYNLGIATRLLPELDASEAIRVWDSVTAAWNEDQLALLARASNMAASLDHDGAHALIESERARLAVFDVELLAACDRAILLLEHAASRLRGRRVRAHTRGKLLGALAFSMSVAACSAPSGPDAAVLRDSGGEMDSGSGGDAATSDAASMCADPARTEQPGVGRIEQCGLCDGSEWQITFDANGEAIAFSTAGGTIPTDIEQCLRDLFAQYCYPTLAGTTQTFSSHCWLA